MLPPRNIPQIPLVWSLTTGSADFKLQAFKLFFPFMCLEGKACCSAVQAVSRLSYSCVYCSWRQQSSATWFLLAMMSSLALLNLLDA